MQDTITARFKVQSTASKDNSVYTILVPVENTSPGAQGLSFWDASPKGFLEVYVSNPESQGFFQMDQEYLLSLAVAPKKSSG